MSPLRFADPAGGPGAVPPAAPPQAPRALWGAGIRVAVLFIRADKMLVFKLGAWLPTVRGSQLGEAG